MDTDLTIYFFNEAELEERYENLVRRPEKRIDISIGSIGALRYAYFAPVIKLVAEVLQVGACSTAHVYPDPSLGSRHVLNHGKATMKHSMPVAVVQVSLRYVEALQALLVTVALDVWGKTFTKDSTKREKIYPPAR